MHLHAGEIWEDCFPIPMCDGGVGATADARYCLLRQVEDEGESYAFLFAHDSATALLNTFPNFHIAFFSFFLSPFP